MPSDEQQIVDWVNFPDGTPMLSLWDTLHDGDLLSIASDLLVRTVTLRFDVGYVRDFHHLSEQTRFIIVVNGVRSVRCLRKYRGRAVVQSLKECQTHSKRRSSLNTTANGVKNPSRGVTSKDWLVMV